MNIIKTDIPEVLIFEPRVFGDARGFFFESFSSKFFDEAVGRKVEFVQITILSRRRASCAVYITSLTRMLKVNWFAVLKERFLTWRLISVALPQLLVNG